MKKVMEDTAAVVLVSKPDASLSCCKNYRALNDITMKDSYLLPWIDYTFDLLVGVKWFSALAMKLGYHQLNVAMEDKKKTPFFLRPRAMAVYAKRQPRSNG